MPGAMAVAVVTDSTAYLPDASSLPPLTVVPLTVVVGGRAALEGVEVSPFEPAGPSGRVTTSRPSVDLFSRTYQDLFASGATGIVSIHLSGRLSGTVSTARLAAADFGDRVAVVDAHSTGMGLGFPAMAAQQAATAGGDLATVTAAAHSAVGRTRTYFCVDTLDHLRLGGRIGEAAAIRDTALAVKPILAVSAEGVIVIDRVRTAGRAVQRLAELVVSAVDGGLIDLAIHHVAVPERAEALLAAIVHRLGERLRHRYVTEMGAVVAAHVGPGALGVIVYRYPQTPSLSTGG